MGQKSRADVVCYKIIYESVTHLWVEKAMKQENKESLEGKNINYFNLIILCNDILSFLC